MKKTVLITGASHGLGRALTARFLGDGWFVIATDVDDLSLAWLADHAAALALRMDVASDASVAEAFRAVSAKQIMIDLLINNAGIDRYFPLSEAPVEDFKSIFEVNLFGSYRVNQVFLPLVRQPGGRILFIGSESYHLALPFMPYPMTKMLIEQYARALRQELRFHGIDVTVVRPGAINTRLLNTVKSLEEHTTGWKLSEPFMRFADQASGEIGTSVDPSNVADRIARIAAKPRPAALYRLNNSVKLRWMKFIPFCLLERLIHGRLRSR